MTLSLSPAIGQLIVKSYIALDTQIKYCEGVLKDPASPSGLKQLFSQYLTKLRWMEQDMARRFSGQTKLYFQEELKANDLLKFEAVKEYMLRMTPEQQDMVEDMVRLMSKGEKIIIEKIDTDERSSKTDG